MVTDSRRSTSLQLELSTDCMSQTVTTKGYCEVFNSDNLVVHL